MVASSAQATLIHDTPLISPPGYYNGSDNPNEGFTVNLQDGIGLVLAFSTARQARRFTRRRQQRYQ